MRQTFPTALELLWAREESKPAPVSKKRGATKLGLTRRIIASWMGCRCCDVQLDDLEKGGAGAILHIWFWRGVRADELPPGLDYALFCHAVASGPRQAITDLQYVLTMRPTGEMDGRTLRAVERADVPAMIRSLSALRRRAGADEAELSAIEAQALAMAT